MRIGMMHHARTQLHKHTQLRIRWQHTRTPRTSTASNTYVCREPMLRIPHNIRIIERICTRDMI